MLDKGCCDAPMLDKGCCDAPMLFVKRQCLTRVVVTRQCLTVFQEGNNLVVKVRTVTESAEQLDPLTPILTIDVTKIVQPL
jgi:hypothetical protein